MTGPGFGPVEFMNRGVLCAVENRHSSPVRPHSVSCQCWQLGIDMCGGYNGSGSYGSGLSPGLLLDLHPLDDDDRGRPVSTSTILGMSSDTGLKALLSKEDESLLLCTDAPCSLFVSSSSSFTVQINIIYIRKIIRFLISNIKTCTNFYTQIPVRHGLFARLLLIGSTYYIFFLNIVSKH